MAETHMKMAFTILTPPLLPTVPKARKSFKTDRLAIKALNLCNYQRAVHVSCGARRRIRYDDGDEEENEYNEEIAVLEIYTQSARDEALLVHALVEGQQVEVLIFKGFSSCLSYGTSPDPSKSVIPRRAVIQSIDRIKGPFDPNNIQYIETGRHWEYFKTRVAAEGGRR